MADATSVHWFDGGAVVKGSPTGTINKVPLGGGAVVTLATGQNVRSMAIDATSIYWTDPVGGTVMKLPK